MNKLSLTEKEIKLLEWIEVCNCQNGLEGFSFEVSIDRVSPYSNKIARGLLSDLIKKNILIKYEDDWYECNPEFIEQIREIL